MASAEKSKVVREVTQIVADDVVVLTLTLEEARTLKKVTQRSGGPREGRRGHMHEIGRVLYPLVGYIDDYEIDVDGELTFRD